MRQGLLVGLFAGIIGGGAAAGADPSDTAVPEAFARFEHLIGSWKGTAVPRANPVKGWPETHAWAWKFSQGRPVGMTVELRGDKSLAKGRLTFAADAGPFRLEGTDPEGKPVVYLGAMDKAGRALVLDRVGGMKGGKERLTLRLNSNLIRYTLELDHQEAGAPQYKRVVDIGLTKEGESFAAGDSAADLPKCILTGGAATMTVAYGGRSYPVCCSGCRDEFNENPEKYVKKAASMAPTGATPAKARAAKVSRGDDAFDGLVEERRATESVPRTPAPPKAAAPRAETPTTTSKADAGRAAAARAASQLRLGQNLEKAGKAAAALGYYRQVVKDHPGTPEAKAAAARIRALGGD